MDKVYTCTAKSMMKASMRAYDASLKEFLSEKAVLARIMKDCLPEYRDLPARDIANLYIEGQPEVSKMPVDRIGTTLPKITGSSTEDTDENEGTVYYDIRFLASVPSGEGYIRLIINVEAQKNDNLGYPLVKRGIYYCSRMLSAQHGVEFEKSDYGNIKKVYSIWICYSASHFKNTISRYQIKRTDEIGEITEPKSDYDLMQVIIIRLGEVDQSIGDSVLNMLNTVFSNHLPMREKVEILDKKYGIPMTEKIEGEVAGMCNVSYGIYEDGIEEGILSTLISLVKKKIITVKQASEEVNMSEADFFTLMNADS